MTLASPSIAQNSAAIVTSMPTRMEVSAPTSPFSKPESTVDVVDEGLHELIDDVEIVHREISVRRVGDAVADEGGELRLRGCFGPVRFAPVPAQSRDIAPPSDF